LAREGDAMPMHDWTRVDVGIYHDFHQGWTVNLSRALNAGILPNGFRAMIEYRPRDLYREYDPRESDAEAYARRANRIAIHAGDDDRIVSLISIVSPGNKESSRGIRRYLSQLVRYLERGAHLLVVDPLPPTSAVPIAVHRLVRKKWSGTPIGSSHFRSPFSIASFNANDPSACVVDEFDCEQTVPDTRLILERDLSIRAPLESTYQYAWSVLPEITRGKFVSPAAST
jgi:hypothetical protein